MWVVAAREYRAAVWTKSFLISLVVMPVLVGGSWLIQWVLKDVKDTQEKRFAVIDRTPGQTLFPVLEAAARQRNETQIYDPGTKKQTQPAFSLERVEPSPDTEAAVLQQRYELSERVRKGELFAFLEIGPEVYRVTPPDSGQTPGRERTALRYQSNRPTYRDFERWAETVINEAVRDKRCEQTKVDRGTVQAIVEPVPLRAKGLSKRNPATGAIEEAPDENRVASVLVPFGLMMLMFMMLMVCATPLMQGVVEEKMQRIAEVLLGSVRPFELMMGKLLGMTGVALTLAAVYLAGGYWALQHYGYADFITPDVLGWFLVFLVLAVLMYGSLFIAIGAACTDMKETQSMLMPVMMLAVLPLFVWFNVIREPTSSFSTWISFFPPGTPMLMIARQAVPPGIPLWQPAVGILLVLLTTVFCVYAAGRIFRVGLLMQGKGAKIGELVRWVVRG
jgi:ABC-2 type transport system permease protein